MLLASFSLVSRCRLLIAVVSFVVEQALGPVGLVAQQHMESSQARDQTLFPCTSRHILNLWTIREVHSDSFNMTSHLVHIPNFSFNPRMSWRTAGFPPPKTGAFQIKYCNFYSFLLYLFPSLLIYGPSSPTPPTHTQTSSLFYNCMDFSNCFSWCHLICSLQAKSQNLIFLNFKLKYS